MTNFFLTLVASNEDLTEQTLNIVGDYADITWLAENRAADIHLNQPLGDAAIAYIREQLAKKEIDVFYTSSDNRRKKLVLADMDGTIVDGETLDDIGIHAGVKDQIAAITQRAMNAEIGFEQALKERVALLKDLPASKLDETLAETRLAQGARTFIATMKASGAHCVLVSGGFQFFTEAIAKKAGFDNHHGNKLKITDGLLTGQVIPPILDREAKLNFLNHYCKQRSLKPEQALTIGDGANDLAMLKAAGLGLGFHAKPAVASQLSNIIRFGNLTAALFAQGFKQEEFVN